MDVFVLVHVSVVVHSLCCDVYTGADTGFPERGGGEAPPPLGHCPRDVIRPPNKL